MDRRKARSTFGPVASRSEATSGWRENPNHPLNAAGRCHLDRRLYVLVYAEEVRRIVLLLHLRQTRIVGAERRLDRVGVLFAQEVQEVGTAGMGLHRLRHGPRPGHVLAALGRVR